MDRRRALLNGGFPQNYLFKQGLGFRKDIAWGQATTSKGTGYISITKDSIHLDGYYGVSSSTTAPSILYIGSPKIEYDTSNRLLKNAISVEGFKTIYFHGYVKQSDGTRKAYIGLIKCSKLPNGYIKSVQSTSGTYVPGGSDTYWDAGEAVHRLMPSDRPDGQPPSSYSGEFTVSFDISSINETMIALWSGDFSSRDLIIYDIWLE